LVIVGARIFTRDHWTMPATYRRAGESKPVNHGKALGVKPITLKPSSFVRWSCVHRYRIQDEEGFARAISAIDALIDVVWKQILAGSSQDEQWSSVFQKRGGSIGLLPWKKKVFEVYRLAILLVKVRGRLAFKVDYFYKSA
jgi:hypothetical protein